MSLDQAPPPAAQTPYCPRGTTTQVGHTEPHRLGSDHRCPLCQIQRAKPPLERRISEAFGPLTSPSTSELRAAIEACRLTIDDLGPHLQDPAGHPYGRKPLLVDHPHVELLVMTWARGMECAPHDHGSRSWGWVLVVAGTATHTVFTLDKGGRPVPGEPKPVKAGAFLFTRVGLVHSMGNLTREPLVTVHAYAPPITGMTVYDLGRCAKCPVRDGCGAWWPQDQQRLLEVQLPRQT
jgi:cysteine dioxygenase